MQKQVYSFMPVKILRIEGTSLAVSFEIDEKSSGTIIRLYQISDEEQTYKRIGLRTVPIPLYVAIKSHRRAISEVINKFMDVHPQYEYLLKY